MCFPSLHGHYSLHWYYDVIRLLTTFWIPLFIRHCFPYSILENSESSQVDVLYRCIPCYTLEPRESICILAITTTYVLTSKTPKLSSFPINVISGLLVSAFACGLVPCLSTLNSLHHHNKPKTN